MPMLLSLLLALALAAPTATAAAPDKPRAGKVRLKAFESCTGLVRYARRNALRTVRPLSRRPVPLPPNAGGQDDGGAGAPVQEEGAGVGGPPEHSGTNVQELGVDEPDIVKTDGARLFVVSGNELHAVDPRGPTKLGSLPLGDDGYGHELLLHGDRLLLLSRIDGPFDTGLTDVHYGVPRTRLAEIDVSEPRHMRTVRSVVVDGAYVSARLTGDTARVVVTSPPRVLTSARRIRAAGARAWRPRAEHRRRGSDRRRRRALVACDAVRRPSTFSGLDMVSVLTIDMQKGLPAVDVDAVMTDAETVYASADSLYVATRRWIDPTRREPPERMRTAIHRFDASQPGRTAYRSSGEVRGYLLSQWALSEHAGHLRIASTEAPDWWGGRGLDSESRVTVLREQDGRLAEVGRVGGLGRGERIYAVRFIGDVGYVVTFRQVDPLYTVDLSTPTAPRLLGELKIRGFSAYLHPVGDGLLLGVGQDATPEGRTLGTQLSLFDISDLRNPVRLHQRTLEEGTASEIEYDHRAFLHWPATGLTVIPFEQYAEDEFTTGAAVFQVGPAGIADAGRIAHPVREPWRGRIARAVVIGDRLFTISEKGVMASPIETPADGTWLPL